MTVTRGWKPTRQCKTCGVIGDRIGWPHYARSGRLSLFCSTCHAKNNEILERANQALCQRCGLAPAVNHSRCRACDRMDSREQREREASAQGNAIKAYVSQDAHRFQAAMAKAEGRADRLRARWAAAYLRPFRGLSLQEQAAAQRKHYKKYRLQESDRIQKHKAFNPDRKKKWDDLRLRREVSNADGSIVRGTIARLKSQATHCAYCDVRLLRKQTDHMIPLAGGGEHSVRNLVIVCQDCNQRKHALSYEQWIERVELCHRARVIAVFDSRYGMQHAGRVAA